MQSVLSNYSLAVHESVRNKKSLNYGEFELQIVRTTRNSNYKESQL